MSKARAAKIQVFHGRDGQWYVRIRAANGGILVTTEGYVSLSNANRLAKKLAFTTGLPVVVMP